MPQYCNFNAKSGFPFFFTNNFFCLALYWKVEFPNLAPHLVCFCTLILFLRNSRIHFRTSMCWAKGISRRVARFDKTFSSVGKTHFTSLISSLENRISNPKALRNENHCNKVDNNII
jgi:hypothetical protein